MPSTRTTKSRPPWDDGRPKKPQPTPTSTQLKMAWSNGRAQARDPKAVDVKAVAASSSCSVRVSNVFGAVEHVAVQLNALSRVVADMSVRVRAVEQLIR